MKTGRLLFLSFLLLLALWSGAGPQSSAQTGGQSDSTVIRVTSHLILVDVVATDSKGVPISDLKREDFSLTEDGRPQKVSQFSFYQGRLERPTPVAASAEEEAASIVSNRPRFTVNGPLNVLLLDGLNTNVRDQKYARDQMLKFLEKLPADRPVAVFALGMKLYLLQDFTTDPTLLKAAIKGYREKGSPTLASPTGTSIMADMSPIALETLGDFAPAMRQQITALRAPDSGARFGRLSWPQEPGLDLRRFPRHSVP